MTTNLIDLQNSDVLLITSNMAENHPVGFQWVLKAKERGAILIHVDPRFTRTTSLCDIHVPIRSGTNIAFFGGLINFAIQNDLIHREYVAKYTNAAALIHPDFDFSDGIFTGLNEEGRLYDRSTWRYQVDQEGKPLLDETLSHSRSVFQLLKKHYSRYTPEMVESVCGLPRGKFLEVARIFCSTSSSDKSGVIVYALNLTQHTTGVQNIRAACMLQLLLGNIGVKGGGVAALRGHANVQGATDLALLYQDLPGYISMPVRDQHPSLQAYLEKETPPSGYWVNKPKFLISLLKAWYGEGATEENDFGYNYLPKLASKDNYSHQHMFVDMFNGKIKGFLCIGQNPAVGGPNAILTRSALARLDWLVVKDLFVTETAHFWRAPGINPSDIQTEVFFLPAAAGAEKEGSITNTMRLVQWHHKAADPPGDVRSDGHFIYDLGRRLKALYSESDKLRDLPIKHLTWDYGEGKPDMEKVLKEMNGYRVSDGEQLKSFGQLKDDGSTAAGIWIYTGVHTGANNAARRSITGTDYLEHEWAFSWPANRRILYNRASADPSGRPWSQGKGVIRWDPSAGDSGRWVGDDVPDFGATKAPTAPGGTNPFIMKPDGRGALFGPLNDGPFPEHYEPIEAPVKNSLSAQQNNPVAKIWKVDGRNLLGDPEKYPIVVSTYRVTEHHLSGSMSRQLPWLAEMFSHHFFEISQELAQEKGIRSGDLCAITTPRGTIRARAMVTIRFKPFNINGRRVHQIGIPWHWGYEGISRGDVTNDLSATVGDPNVYIQETKAFLCDLRKVEEA